MSTARSTPPALGRVAVHWMEAEDLADTFPSCPGIACGWSEPFCFRCGWFTPTKASGLFTAPRKDPLYQIVAAWDAGGGWLERAHIHDHRHGGPGDVSNLVPLCVLCHEDQEPCATREEGIAFVNTYSHRRELTGLVQWFTDLNYRNQGRPGRSDAIRKLLRAHSEMGAAFAAEARKTLG